jgi:hypothetical protein
MSNRFMRWAVDWVDENVIPGAHKDVESDEAAVKRLMEKMSAEAREAGFSQHEIDQEKTRVPRQVLAAATRDTEFDIDAYQLDWLLAMEHPDGD